MNFSFLPTSSSVNGSVATLSGLVQLPLLGAEKDELPQDETEESENDEPIDPERWNAGRLSWRESLISDHSCTGDVLGVNRSDLGSGVLGATSCWMVGRGMRKPSEEADGSKFGLEVVETASVISMVGVTVSASKTKGIASRGTTGTRRRFNRNGAALGGGGGSIADCCSANCSGVLGREACSLSKSNNGRSMESVGRGRAMAAGESGDTSDVCSLPCLSPRGCIGFCGREVARADQRAQCSVGRRRGRVNGGALAKSVYRGHGYAGITISACPRDSRSMRAADCVVGRVEWCRREKVVEKRSAALAGGVCDGSATARRT